MTNWAALRRSRIEGSSAAIREVAKRHLDPGRRVDVFKIIEDERIWLLFQPLGRLYGFFERVGSAAGIVVHSRHPLSLQRFTAAHEFGHYVLGHQLSVDSEEKLHGTSNDPHEVAAQAFAADFLMPMALVNRALDRLGLRPSVAELTAEGAYQLALELGSSYAATVTQLVALKIITKGSGQRLKAVRPLDVKISIAGSRPGSTRVDLWTVTKGQHRDLVLGIADQLHIEVPEIPTSGYRWAIMHTPPGLDLAGDDSRPPGEAGEAIGASTVRHFVLTATHPVNSFVDLQLRREWEPASEAVDSLHIDVRVLEPAVDATGSGVSRRQGRAILQAA
jgi:predicted secreted protein